MILDQIVFWGGLLLEIFLIITIVDIFLIGLPIPKFVKKLEREHFLITKPNHSEIQGKVECSAYASAYVYRHLGINVTGAELYQEMPCKAPNGYVFCNCIFQGCKVTDTKFYTKTIFSGKFNNSTAKNVAIWCFTWHFLIQFCSGYIYTKVAINVS